MMDWYDLYPAVQTIRGIDGLKSKTVASFRKNTFQIYFGAMMDDTLEVFPAFKGRGRAPAVKVLRFFLSARKTVP
jgi:hypothetical protein